MVQRGSILVLLLGMAAATSGLAQLSTPLPAPGEGTVLSANQTSTPDLRASLVETANVSLSDASGAGHASLGWENDGGSSALVLRDSSEPDLWWARWSPGGGIELLGGADTPYFGVVSIGGALRLQSVALLQCDSTRDGIMAFVAGGGGSPDGIFACLKSYDGSYSWVPIASG